MSNNAHKILQALQHADNPAQWHNITKTIKRLRPQVRKTYNALVDQQVQHLKQTSKVIRIDPIYKTALDLAQWYTLETQYLQAQGQHAQGAQHNLQWVAHNAQQYHKHKGE